MGRPFRLPQGLQFSNQYGNMLEDVFLPDILTEALDGSDPTIATCAGSTVQLPAADGGRQSLEPRSKAD